MKYRLSPSHSSIFKCIFGLFLATNSLAQEANGPIFKPDEDWKWTQEPRQSLSEVDARIANPFKNAVSFLVHGDKLFFLLACRNGEGGESRPAVFDQQGQKVSLRGPSSTFQLTEDFTVYVYTSPIIESPFYVGIESLSREAQQEEVKATAESAALSLRDAGISPLPFPEEGKPFPFELTTLNGERLSSDNLKGKVVLIDLWAGWCGPCMSKMPALKETYSRFHARGLEVIGISHDPSRQDALNAAKKADLPWSIVLAPVSQPEKALWWKATGTSGIPRLLLIDRNGRLHSSDLVCGEKLDTALETLLQNSNGQ